MLTRHLVRFNPLSHWMDMLETSACIQALQFTHHRLSTAGIHNTQRMLAITIHKMELVPKVNIISVY